ncbi:hypothetical protein I552_9934 [Mycobacterium xenopi 3993]|nr:hypothetical protein I552_9934 [Mycobacterium xenopi 3993]
MAHTVDVNAVTVDTGTGRSCTPIGCGRPRRWTAHRSAG